MLVRIAPYVLGSEHREATSQVWIDDRSLLQISGLRHLECMRNHVWNTDRITHLEEAPATGQ